MSVRKYYTFTYLAILHAIRAQGRDGFERWKASLILMGAWLFVFALLALACELRFGMPAFRLFEGSSAAVMLGIAFLITELPLRRDSRFRDFEKAFNQLQPERLKIWTSSVVIAMFLIPASFFTLLLTSR